VLLGRRTYDEWAAFWPGRKLGLFSSFINPVQKFVFTSKPLAVEWTNTTAIDGDLVTFISGLKRENGGDIGVHGSISLAQDLLGAGLIDELRLVVAPAVQLEGRRFFSRAEPGSLVLTRCDASPGGYLLLDYELRR
jgi:dihydrofolate reductase